MHRRDTRLVSRQLGAKRVSFEIQMQRTARQRKAAHRMATHGKDTRLVSRQLGAKRVSFEIQQQGTAAQSNARQRNAKIRV